MREHTTTSSTATVTPCEAVAYTLHTIPAEKLERMHTATFFRLQREHILPAAAFVGRAPADVFGAAWIAASEYSDAHPLAGVALSWYYGTRRAISDAWREEQRHAGAPSRDEDGRPERAAHVRLDAMEPEAVGALLSDEYSDTPERVYIRRETVAEALAAAVADADDRAIIEMRAAGYTDAETAAALNMPRRTVCNRRAIIAARAQQAQTDATAAAEALADFGARARLAQAWDALHRLAAD